MTELLSQNDLEITKIKGMWFDAFYVSMLSEKIKTGQLKLLKGAIIGLLSNLFAFFGDQEFSSQIFIIKHKKAK